VQELERGAVRLPVVGGGVPDAPLARIPPRLPPPLPIQHACPQNVAAIVAAVTFTTFPNIPTRSAPIRIQGHQEQPLPGSHPESIQVLVSIQ